MNIFGIGFQEMLFILVLALLVLGPSKMVEAARTLGKYIRELQRATAEIPRLLSLEEDQPPASPPPRQQLPQEPAGKEQDPGPEV